MIRSVSDLPALIDALVAIELGGGVALAAWITLCRALDARRRPGVATELRAVSALFFCLVLSLLLYCHGMPGGRAVLGAAPALPGSVLTRSLTVDVSLWLRRLLEPSLWFFWLCLVVAALDTGTLAARRAYLSAALLLQAMLLLEASALAAGGGGAFDGAMRLLHAGIVQGLLLSMLLASALSVRRPREPFRRGPGLGGGLWRRFVPAAAALFAASLLAGAVVSRTGARDLLVGAHYYSWFPENWRGGYLGASTIPPIVPELGEYRSSDPAVAARHVEWATQAGIDFFVLDWWPKRPDVGARVFEHVTNGRFDELQYALMYETFDLRETTDPEWKDEQGGAVILSPTRAYRLKKHWEHLAKRYMGRERYLRVGDRAVLFVYATRHLVGPVHEVIEDARRHVEETTGIRLYLVGDEVFFNVLERSKRGEVLLLRDGIPSWDRLSAFDAVTCYNPYDESRPEQGGTAGQERFLSQVATLYRDYRGIAAAAGVRFVPGVIPGYNDRTLRPALDHFVIPREGVGKEESFFSRALEAWVRPFYDSTVPMAAVTSWNEWNEGTQIEPTRPSPPTAADRSSSGSAFTAGELHRGYGMDAVDQLANFLSSLEN